MSLASFGSLSDSRCMPNSVVIIEADVPYPMANTVTTISRALVTASKLECILLGVYFNC